MSSTSLHRVVIYHDETKDVPKRNFKGHVLLFVPTTLSVESETPLLGTSQEEYFPRELFLTELIRCRQKFDCDGKLHFAEISGQTWNKYDCAYHKAIALAVDALRSKSPQIFSRPLNCKIATIFYPKGADWDIYGGDSRKEQKLRHDETLLRILLKGAGHYLYDDSNRIEVTKIVSDGYPAHRELDEDRVVWRLIYDGSCGKTPLRDYVTFSEDASIVHLPSDHKKYQPDTEEYKHANFLQIADLLLGAIMRSCYVGARPIRMTPKIGDHCNKDHCNKRDVIAQPVKEMLDKRKRGIGFRNSGHYKSFTITQVTFSNDGINFQEVQSVDIQDKDLLQMSLFIDDSVD
ncbi:hypothetical protein [Candidatus Methylacidiphilum infernorum]|uniref:DUF3800 domain-containing protein n=1 Tax=Methylacidiphilum infernorum (isolate V4) TaxID=481448 RepID=B3DXE9_METI4|nr:hypothetical protein [Candidatus Methylacidiphilum infernorum]ACD83858.1 Conserved hypothetical protein [Methylacidiphilum infernorum V4]